MCMAVSPDGISRLVPVHRCLSERLGSITSTGINKWNIHNTQKIPAHQHLGTQSKSSSQGFYRAKQMLRQYHSTIISSQGRGYVFYNDQYRSSKDLRVDRGKHCQDPHPVCQAACVSRLQSGLSIRTWAIFRVSCGVAQQWISLQQN